MKFQRKKLFLIILCSTIPMLFICSVYLSRQLALRRFNLVPSLSDDVRVIDCSLSKTWPFHWHVNVLEQSHSSFFPDDPTKTIVEKWCCCISLRGELLHAFPIEMNVEKAMQKREDARMQCVFHRGKEWVVLTESAVKKSMKDAKVRPRKSDNKSDE